MSRIKKLIVAVLCVVLAVTASLLVFAACDKDETGYKVTLNYIKEQGSVTVSAPAEGKLYDANERVTVTVTPNADYQVAAFTVNGTAQNLTDGTTYTFQITADTTVAVTFEEKCAWSKYLGKYVGYDEYETDYTMTITEEGIELVVYSESYELTNIQYSATDGFTFDLVIGEESAPCTVKATDDAITSILFECPGAEISITLDRELPDIIPEKYVGTWDGTEENVTGDVIYKFVINANGTGSASYELFGDTELVGVHFVIENDKLVMRFKNEATDQEEQVWIFQEDGETLTTTGITGGKLTLTRACAWSDYIGVFESDPAEDEEYGQPATVLTITADSISVQSGTTTYTASVGEFEFDESFYVMFTFTKDSNEFTIYFTDSDSGMVEASGDDVEIYASVYRQGTHCAWESMLGIWAGNALVGSESVPVTVEITITSVTITIGDDEQTTEDIHYSSSFYGNELTFTIGETEYTITEDFGTVSLSYGRSYVQLHKQRDPNEPIEWPAAYEGDYEGTYTTEEGVEVKYAVSITSEAVFITIDDGDEQQAEIVEFDDYEGFTVRLNGVTYYIAQFGYGDPVEQLLLGDEGYDLQVRLTRKEDDSNKIDSKYFGTWTGTDANENDVEIVITENSVTWNGSSVNYWITDGNLCFTRIADYTATVSGDTLTLTPDASSFQDPFTLTRTGQGGGDEEPTCEWEYYIGTYRGYDGSKFYTIIIDEDSITINLDGSLAKVVIVEYYGDTEGFEITVNGETRLLQDKSYAAQHSTWLMFASEDYSTVNFDLSREADANEWVDLADIAGTWTGTESASGMEIEYTLVIHADGTGTAQASAGGETLTFYDARYEITWGHLCLYYKSEQDAEVEQCMVFYYDGTNFNVVAATQGGSLTLTKTAGGDEETVTIPDKFIGEYSDSGYEVTITADSITITVKGTTETPNSTYTATNIKVDGNTITCTAIGDTCTITAIGDGDKAQQITLRIPSIGTRTLDRKAESGGDTDLTEESFYGTFEGDDYTLVISADGVTFSDAVGGDFEVTAHSFDAATDTYTFTSMGMNFTITAVSDDNPVTTIHLVCDDAGIAVNLTRTTAGDDDTGLTEESFYGTFEGTDGSSITITAEGVTSFNVSGIGEFSGTSHEFDAATGTYKFTANGNDFTITAKSNDNPITQILIHHVQNQLGDMTLTRKAEEEEPACEWTEYIGTWYAAEDSDVYEIVISADGLNITHPGDSYTVSADDTTFNFDPETGFTWTYQDVEYKLEISDDRLYFTDVAEEGDYYMYLSRVD